jgi:F0F1-type ATP synthase assembly protein I
MDRHEREIWREALRATSLGWDLALPIFGGILLGYLLDRALGATYLFTLAFLLLGIATGFYNVIRSIQRLDRRCQTRRFQTEEREREENETTP